MHDHPTRSSVARFSGFFSFYTISPFQLFRQQQLFRCRNFHHFLTFWLARNSFGVIFSFVYTVFALFTFHVLVAYGGLKGLYLKFYFSQAFEFSELKLQIQLKESQLKLLKFAAISRIKNVFLSNFRTFPNFSKCKALGDFLISFLEIVHLKGCLGGISQNSNFQN